MSAKGSPELREEIRFLLAGVLRIPVAELPQEPSPELLEQWDSLHHVALMIALEDKFGLAIDPELIPSLVSLTAIGRFIEAEIRPEPGHRLAAPQPASLLRR